MSGVRAVRLRKPSTVRVVKGVYTTNLCPRRRGCIEHMNQESARTAQKCITHCNLEAIITESKFLHAESLQELIKFLVAGSRQQQESSMQVQL